MEFCKIERVPEYHENLPMDENDDQVMTGTTIMAAIYKGGVVMGADTRTSAGQFVVNRAARKLSRLHYNIFVARSGSAAHTQLLTLYVKRYLGQHAIEKNALPTVNSAASLMQLMNYSNRNFLLAGLIVAGWDPENGPKVFQIPVGGAKLEQDIAIGGSGSGYISSYVKDKYRTDFTKEECQEFVKNCVGHAIYMDGSSGGMIRLITIDSTGVEESFVNGDELPIHD